MSVKYLLIDGCSPPICQLYFVFCLVVIPYSSKCIQSLINVYFNATIKGQICVAFRIMVLYSHHYSIMVTPCSATTTTRIPQYKIPAFHGCRAYKGYCPNICLAWSVFLPAFDVFAFPITVY